MRKFVLAARLAVTVHVPGEVVLRTPLTTLQPAVPALTSAYVYAPGPEPPDAVRVRSVP
jgi:hypothetical protein